MKKTVAWLLALLLCLSLAACGDSGEPSQPDRPSENGTDAPDAPDAADEPEDQPDPEPVLPELSLDSPNSIDGIAEYEISTVYAANDILPPKPDGIYTHYEAKTGNQLVAAVMDVKNLQSSALPARELLSAVLSIDGAEYTSTCVIEEDGGADLGSGSNTVDPLSEARLYHLFEIPGDADTEHMTLTVTAGEDIRTVSLGLQQFESAKKPIVIGEEITDGETLSLTIDSISFATTLYPPKATGYYHYYEAESGKTYLIVKATAKNLKGTEMKYSDIAGVSAVYNDKYNYSSFAVLEKDGGADLNGYPNQYSIDPLDSGVVYYLIEVPAEVESGKVDLSFYISGDYYTYTIGG